MNDEIKDEYERLTREEFLARWPDEAPPSMGHLSRDDARRFIEAADLANSMPEAELTPDLVDYRRIVKASGRIAWRAFLDQGHLLLEMRNRLPDDAFWDFVKEKLPKASRDYIELAIRAALTRAA